MVGELDVLRTEGEQYAAKLQKAGVEVDLQVMKGMPHPFLAMDGVLTEGKRSITLMCDTLNRVFHNWPWLFHLNRWILLVSHNSILLVDQSVYSAQE